jgi:hypothetical protein
MTNVLILGAVPSYVALVLAAVSLAALALFERR